jgi:hypothetical protein
MASATILFLLLSTHWMPILAGLSINIGSSGSWDSNSIRNTADSYISVHVSASAYLRIKDVKQLVS